MIQLSNLKDTHRPKQKKKRVGRGPGSKVGKTCGRGHKGDKARSGYKRREGKEGGQLPLYQKIPCRGFTRGRFKKEVISINLERLNEHFEDGDSIDVETLRMKGLVPRKIPGGVKILGNGELKKKVFIEIHKISAQARKKLESNSIDYKIIPLSAK